MKRVLLIPIILTVASHLGAQARDFLAGNWIVRDRSGRVLGTDSISKAGCTWIELWREAASGREGLGVRYQLADGTWHQELITHTGFVLSLDGTMDGASLVMTGKEYPGRGVIRIHRIRWTPMHDGTIEQLWQTSTDDGQSWQVHFEGVFQRISE
jgi:hypothetical protein